MYYKAMLDDTPVDVFAVLVYCKYVDRSKMVLRCGENDSPQGIISERNGTYYHVDGWADFPDNVSVDTVELVEIEESVYEALLEALDSGSEIPDTDTGFEYPADATLEYVQSAKVTVLETASDEAVAAGFDLTLSDGVTYRFTMKDKDQIAAMSVLMRAQMGEDELDFYASGQCLTLSTEDAILLGTTATVFRSYHEAYCHCLTNWVNALTVITEVAAVQYGDTVPEDYRNAYLIKYATALGVTEYAATE